MHHTKDKGDLALTKVIADLTEKGYSVYLPISEHSKADLIAENGKIYRIQVKHCIWTGSIGSIQVRNKTSWSDKNGNHVKQYQDGDFDYYGLYLKDINQIIYVPFEYGGKFIRYELPINYGHYYWYEDFLQIGNKPEKRHKKSIKSQKKIIQPKKIKIVWPTKEQLQKLVQEKTKTSIAKDLGVSISSVCSRCKFYEIESPKIGSWSKGITKQSKISWPSKEELEKLVWEKSTLSIAKDLGVSDSAIGKKCKAYGIQKPPRGYWEKQYHKITD